MKYGENITVDKNNLSIRLEGAMPTREILSSLDEIVDAAIAAPSNYTPAVNGKKRLMLITLLDVITTKNLQR
ncbi:MAG: hypothetical protein IKP65_06270 [Alphaproteobacteria bacterium]|nr:hypothetical protein [Alphaproteobacteria bacterium]